MTVIRSRPSELTTIAAATLLLFGCGSKTGLGGDRSDGGRSDDARPEASADAGLRDVPPSMPTSACALAEPNALVSGMTPLGFVSFPFSWAGQTEACGVTLLKLSTEQRLRVDELGNTRPAESSLTIDVMASPEGHAGELEGMASLRVGGVMVTGTARVEISTYDRPGDDPRGRPAAIDGWCRCSEERVESCGPRPNVRTLVVRLEISGDEWSLTGSLTPRHCHVFHSICI